MAPGSLETLALAAWLGVAFVFTAVGGLQLFPPPFPQLVLAGLVVVLACVYGWGRSFRSRVQAIPASYLVALHLSRFVGFYFLALHARGELPYAFAVLGGWGDVVVASLALVLLVAFRGRLAFRSAWLQGWNAIGLADILFVVATAARSAMASPESMAPLTQLPLGLLPTFLVPLIVTSHAAILIGGLRARRGAAA